MKLDDFRKSKGWSYGELARQLGAGHNTIARRWCLPHDHPQRSIPGPEYMDRIVRLSHGEVMPNDFYLRRD